MQFNSDYEDLLADAGAYSDQQDALNSLSFAVDQADFEREQRKARRGLRLKRKKQEKQGFFNLAR